jgi:hypothetical protein
MLDSAFEELYYVPVIVNQKCIDARNLYPVFKIIPT